VVGFPPGGTPDAIVQRPSKAVSEGLRNADLQRVVRQDGAREAALVNGTASHMLDFDDAHLQSRVHPSVPLWPAILAQAEGGRHHGITASMQQVRRLGYAINRGEWRPGVNGLAAPIFDGAGAVIAAVGISGPDTRLRPTRLRDLAAAVCEAAEQLSTGLGEFGPHASLLRVTNHWGGLR